MIRLRNLGSSIVSKEVLIVKTERELELCSKQCKDVLIILR